MLQRVFIWGKIRYGISRAMDIKYDAKPFESKDLLDKIKKLLRE